MPDVGDVIGGRYVVERVLGRGGMGEVVAARHMDLGHRVALKFLKRELAQDPDARARFLREARAAVRLGSQHVARVLDMATRRDGTPYIVMELLEGADLASVIRASGPLPVGVAADWVLQVCEALVEAHAAKIVHRDLKPENLFLCRRTDGTPVVKVIDFGISKVERPVGDEAKGDTGDSGLTTENRMLGSVAHMSPEQIRSARDVDARCDVWALGVILFEFLGGKRPFERETVPEVLRAILESDPPRLRELRPEVPPQVEAVVTKCLQKDRDLRFSAVKELVLALERALKEACIERTKIWWPTGSLETLPSLDVDVAPTSTHDGAMPGPRQDVDAPSVARVATKKLKKRRKARKAKAAEAGSTPTSTRSAARPATPPAPAPYRVPARPPLWTLALGVACVAAAWLGGTRWGSVDGTAAAAAAAIAAPAPAPSAELARITVEVRPPAAKLVVDGRAMPNPWTAQVPRDRAPHVVEASAPGYLTERHTVSFERDLLLSIGLVPAPSAPAAGLAASAPPAE
jgi:serine/threonine protein kinase